MTGELGPLASRLTPTEIEAALVALADLRAGYPDSELDPLGRATADKVGGMLADLDDQDSSET